MTNLTFHMRVFNMQSKPILLGLNSNVGKSGKDTLCEMLNAERFAFADALKNEAALMLGHKSDDVYRIRHALDDQKLKDVPSSNLCILSMPASAYKNHLMVRGDARLEARSPRWHLQQLGMFRRDTDENYWLNQTLSDIDDFLAGTTSFMKEFIVVTDVRMVNEADWLKSKGGILVRVERDWEEPELDFKQKHISDVALDDYPMPVIENHWGHKEDMLEQLKEVLRANRIEI